jgi:hypothetical protein
MSKVIRNKLGPIPDSHFENEPTFPPKNVSPLSKALLEYIEAVRAAMHGTDKYKPGESAAIRAALQEAGVRFA